MGRLNAGIIQVTPFQQNCTILYDEHDKSGVIIDPGGDVDVLVRAIEENGFRIGQIWLTHGHIDHAGGAMDMKDRLGVEIIGPHEDDKPLLDNIENQAARFGLPGDVRNCVPDRFLKEGDTVSFGDHVFKVLHCPGHAPGHVVYFNDAARFAHVGDVLFNGSVGRTDLPGGDGAALRRSILRRLFTLPDETVLLPGHGEATTVGRERRGNPILEWNGEDG